MKNLYKRDTNGFLKNPALNRRSPSPKTPSIFASSNFCIALNNSLNLFFFNLERQMTNLLNCWMLRHLFGFLWFRFLNRKIWCSLSFCFYVFKSQLSWVFFNYCAVSQWWQFWFSLKAGLWICLTVEIHELGRSEAWIVLVFYFVFKILFSIFLFED